MERVEINLVAKGYKPPVEKTKHSLPQASVDMQAYYEGQIITGNTFKGGAFKAEVFKEGDKWFYWYWEE